MTNSWTNPCYGVTHFTLDKIQYTITDYDNFVTLLIYSWISYSRITELEFKTVELAKDYVKSITGNHPGTF